MGLSDSHFPDDLLNSVKQITIVDDDESTCLLWKAYSTKVCPNADIRCSTNPLFILQEITRSNFDL